MQLPAEPVAVKTEEILFGAENGRHHVERYFAPVCLAYVVEPIFVFDEEYVLRVYDVKETPRVVGTVERKVEYVVRLVVVAEVLVPGGGEECEQHLVFGMVTSYPFNQRFALLKFPV